MTGNTNLTQNVALLLNRVSEIVKKFEDQYRKTALKYNIFKVAGISEKEVKMCRVLADFLNPKGLHYRGDVYLKLFIDMIMKPLVEKTGGLDLSKVKVTTEYPIDENRRIDIVIDDGTIFIPIEVKINAGEQENQVSDYAACSRRKNNTAGFIPVFFLTPKGHNPAEAAAKDYVCISFEKHIVPWLSKCLNLEETDKVPPVREIVKQYIKAIKSFCNHMEDEAMENAINDLIIQTDDSYKAALLIYEAVNSEALNFDQKAYELFKDQISKLVKDKNNKAKYHEEVEEEWYYIDIPFRKNYRLCINYNWKSISVEVTGTNNLVSAAEADKIRKTMSGITGVSDKNWGDNVIWASSEIKYPGLENTDNENIYTYELYRIYSKNPEAVADQIVSMTKILENI
jgi:hypothetical protein